MTKKIKSTCFLAALAAAPTLALAAACPQKLPVGFSADTVADDVVANGVQSGVLMVSTPKKLTEAVAAVQAEWEKEGYKVYSSKYGIWTIISVVTNECMTTLQLTEKGNTAGFYALGKPVTRARSGEIKSIFPSGVTSNSEVKSTDSGRKGLTMVGESSRPPAEVVDLFIGHLKKNGWDKMKVSALVGKHKDDVSFKVSAQKSSLLSEVLIFGKSNSEIVANVYELN